MGSRTKVSTKAELIDEIERSWSALESVLAGLPERQLSQVRDDQGWSIQDHLAHMTAWERCCTCFLQGKPRHEGLGVEQALYLSGDEEAINAAIYEKVKNLSLSEALEQRRSTHQKLLRLLEPLSEADFRKPYHVFMPDEPGGGDGTPALQVIYSETAHHFAEHLPWIEALAGKMSD
jgi:hypothetical protein